jgi:CRISPR-associated protein Cas1
MEELRAYLGDRFVLTLINRKQVNINDFIEQGDTGIIMTDNFKKDFIRQWQGRKKEEITHPFLNEKIQIGLLPYAQALLLARYIREDINDYPVFLNQ